MAKTILRALQLLVRELVAPDSPPPRFVRGVVAFGVAQTRRPRLPSLAITAIGRILEPGQGEAFQAAWRRTERSRRRAGSVILEFICEQANADRFQSGLFRTRNSCECAATERMGGRLAGQLATIRQLSSRSRAAAATPL